MNLDNASGGGPPAKHPSAARRASGALVDGSVGHEGLRTAAEGPRRARPHRLDLGADTPTEQDQDALVEELADEALGLGRSSGCSDPAVREIMVVDPQTIFVERAGKMELTGLTFTDDDAVRAVIERIVTPLGRRIDESTPLVDARLRDGSRVNAVIPPLSIRGPCITIRKFAETPLRMEDLVRFGSVTESMARFLERCVKVRKNIVVSGGTGSGKTTFSTCSLRNSRSRTRHHASRTPRSFVSAPARRFSRSASTEPRRQGRVHDPGSRAKRAAHAPGSNRRRGVPRRRSNRHAPGDEHGT